MADKAVVKSVQEYLDYVKKQGIPVGCGVLFGSYVKDKAHEWNDIDLLVVLPHFEENRTTDEYKKLWMFAARTNKRSEPIPVGDKQFKNSRDSLIIEAARPEGQIISLAE